MRIENQKQIRVYNALLGLQSKISAANHANENGLGITFLVLLVLSFLRNLLGLFTIHIQVGPIEKAILAIEWVARGLGLCSILLALLLKIFRNKLDKFKKLSTVVKKLNEGTVIYVPYNVDNESNYTARALKGKEPVKELNEINNMLTAANLLDKTDRAKWYSTFKGWYDAFPGAFSILENGQKDVVGYIVSLPLSSDNFGKAHYNGKSDSIDIDNRAISKNSSTLIFCASFWLDPKALKDFTAARVFLDCFFQKLLGFIGEKELSEFIIYAEPLTFYSQRIVGTLGFKPLETMSKTGHRLYKLDFVEAYIPQIYLAWLRSLNETSVQTHQARP